MLLRPLMQDTLFPTVCYVAGPNELAYLGQLGGIYDAFGLPRPLTYQRGSATLLDSNAMRFLVKHDLPLESLRAQDEAALNQLLEAQLPPTVEASLEDAARVVEERMEALTAAVSQIDTTLEGAARSTLGRMQDDLKKLHTKIIQACKRKDETLRRQFKHAQAQAFPGGQPQEREIGFVYFLEQVRPRPRRSVERGDVARNGLALGDYNLGQADLNTVTPLRNIFGRRHSASTRRGRPSASAYDLRSACTLRSAGDPASPCQVPAVRSRHPGVCRIGDPHLLLPLLLRDDRRATERRARAHAPARLRAPGGIAPRPVAQPAGPGVAAE